MANNKKSLVQIQTPLSSEEDKMEKSSPLEHDPGLVVPSDFEIDIAWELANLTRIAYKDYELFNGDSLVLSEEKDWGFKLVKMERPMNEGNNDREKNLKPSKQDRRTRNMHRDSFLYADSRIGSQRIDEYFIEQDVEMTESSEAFLSTHFANGFVKYRILATYNYLAYSFIDGKILGLLPKPSGIAIPDVDRFGFIVERISESSNKRYIFVIFRGTLEATEWFVNLQFKQQNCLMTKQGDEAPESPLQTSLGFNKIYTDYRPGLLPGEKLLKRLNSLSRLVDEKARKRSLKVYPDEHALHTKSIHDTIEEALESVFAISNDQDQRPLRICISGHSLGAALATIAGMHISQILERIGKREKVNLTTYTFASPRVGNSAFAKECNLRFKTYRMANSEDIVPGVPPAVFRFIGQEMIPGNLYNLVSKLVAKLTGGLTKDLYEHVGYPIVFTSQKGAISSNHNMSVTYFQALHKLRH